MKIMYSKVGIMGAVFLIASCALLQGKVLSPSQVQENIDFLDGQKVTIVGYLIFEPHNYTIWDSESIAETYLDRLDEFKKDPCLNIDVSKTGHDVLLKVSHQRVIISGVINRDIFGGKVAFGSCTVPGIYVDIDSLKVIDSNE